LTGIVGMIELIIETGGSVMNQQMTKEVAEQLAMMDDQDYVARKIRGHWVVWSKAADHIVEFDQRTIDNVMG